jgi:putative oxidoreductase
VKRCINWGGHAILSLPVRWYLAYVFIFACIHKIADPGAFALDVATYDILPLGLVNLTALALPWVELAAGVMFLLGLKIRAAGLMVAGMMVVFIAALLLALSAGIDMSCGCFAGQGAAGEDPISYTTVLRDLGWLALSVYIVLFDKHPIGLDRFFSRRRLAGGVLALLVLGCSGDDALNIWDGGIDGGPVSGRDSGCIDVDGGPDADPGPGIDGGVLPDGGGDPGSCPDNMVLIPTNAGEGVSAPFCIDRYEASRESATAGSAGSGGSVATSRPGVLPWQVVSNTEADAACRAAGKQLCTADQWVAVCVGQMNTAYGYGDTYEPATCNGIDKYCYCDEGHGCADAGPCPYPQCYGDCGAPFRLDPTGANPGCTNSFGVFDMNGNVWEHVRGGDDTRIRGGAYNCGNSELLHRCDYIPLTWTPSARGFRCCK